jgi:prepilin-type N-terminal cleavage/methylation domain-containing protein
MKLLRSRIKPRFSAGKNAFSLTELLVVIAIIAILSAVSVTAIVGISKAGNLTKTVYDIAGFLENARATAMANNTYVCVGFREEIENASKNSPHKVLVTAVMSKTGLVPDLTLPKTYSSIGKPYVFENIALASTLNLTGMDTSAVDIGDANTWSFDQNVGKTKITFDKVMQFSPTGEVKISSSSSRWITVGLQPMQGSVRETKNVAALQISGLTGIVEVFRP